MFGVIRKVIAPERVGLVFVNYKLAKVLGPGVHWVFEPFRLVTVEVIAGELDHRVADNFLEVEEDGFAFVYRNGELATVTPQLFVFH